MAWTIACTRSAYSASVMTWPSLTLPTGNRFSTLKLATRIESAGCAGAVGGAAALIGPRWIVGCPSLSPATGSCGMTL